MPFDQQIAVTTFDVPDITPNPDFSPGDAMTNRQDRRFARRQPPVGLRPGMDAMNASSAVCNDGTLRILP